MAAGFSKDERDEIRVIARDEVRLDFTKLREELLLATQAHAEAAIKTAKALERLSLVVCGDEDLKVTGLITDVDDLKKSKQMNLLERAKWSGVWVGASVVGLGVLRVVWYFLDLLLRGG